MYLKKFAKNSVFVNTFVAKPAYKFTIYNGSTYYKKDFSNTVKNGFAGIFDLNLGTQIQEQFYSLNFYKPTNSFYIPYL